MRTSTELAAQALRHAGFSNREIARELGVNESTIRRKLGKAKPAAPASKSFIVTVRPV